MIHRLAIIVGSVAAAVVVAVGLVATGLGPVAAPVDAEQPAAATASAATAATAESAAAATPITRDETTTVYVRPAPTPRVIHITRRASTPVVTSQPKGEVEHSTRETSSKHHDDDGGGGHHDGGGGHQGNDD